MGYSLRLNVLAEFLAYNIRPRISTLYRIFSMLLYTKEQQKKLKASRAAEFIDAVGGATHLAAMLGGDVHNKMVYDWRAKGIPKQRAEDIQKHPGIPEQYTTEWLLVLDKVPATA